MKISWKALLPVIVVIVLALMPAPAGCPQHAWYYFAIFAGVIVALITEPLPIAAVGIIGVTVVAVLAPWVFFSPQQLAAKGFNPPNAALTWALSGFSNSSVWLIFGAFMFTLGYEKTGLGPRIALTLVKAMGRRTLFLGYAIMFADLILSPFTPSTTARSGGTIYPIVRNIPELYDSKPNDPSYRRIGNYIMWMTLVATCATSSMFVTALSSNLLAVSFVQKTANIEITWVQWFIGHLPVTILMLLFLPVLVYWLNPPEVKQGNEVPKWAGEQLDKLGPIGMREVMFGVMVCCALALWIGGGKYVHTTTVALVVIALMLMTRVVTWNDMLGNSPAWNVLVWFATLIPLADGLARVGFVKWFGEIDRRAYRGILPDRHDGRPGSGVLLQPLHVRERHRARHRTGAGACDGRHGDSRDEHGALLAADVLRIGHDGRHHAVRDGPEPADRRIRLRSRAGLLAPGRDHWHHHHDHSARHPGSVAGVCRMTGGLDV